MQSEIQHILHSGVSYVVDVAVSVLFLCHPSQTEAAGDTLRLIGQVSRKIQVGIIIICPVIPGIQRHIVCVRRFLHAQPVPVRTSGLSVQYGYIRKAVVSFCIRNTGCICPVDAILKDSVCLFAWHVCLGGRYPFRLFRYCTRLLPRFLVWILSWLCILRGRILILRFCRPPALNSVRRLLIGFCISRGGLIRFSFFLLRKQRQPGSCISLLNVCTFNHHIQIYRMSFHSRFCILQAVPVFIIPYDSFDQASPVRQEPCIYTIIVLSQHDTVTVKPVLFRFLRVCCFGRHQNFRRQF